MTQQVLIHAPLAQVASSLEEILSLAMPKDQGFSVTLSARPAPYDRMRYHAKGGPDCFVPLPPLAKEGVLEVWHTNHRDAYFRCASVRLSAAGLPAGSAAPGAYPAAQPGDGSDLSQQGRPAEGCRLDWDPADIRIDFLREWQLMLEAAADAMPVQRARVLLHSDPLYMPPSIVGEARFFASLPEVDTATKQRLDVVFPPGAIRYKRMPGQHEGGDLVRYLIQGDLRDGGDFGEIWLRAGGREWTSVVLCALTMHHQPPSSELLAVLACPPEAQARALAALEARCAAVREDEQKSKIAYLKMVWEGYGKSLPPHWLSPYRPDAAVELARSASRLTETEAFILEQWCKDRPAAEIAAVLGMTRASLNNIVSSLRKRLGPELVPRRRPERAS